MITNYKYNYTFFVIILIFIIPETVEKLRKIYNQYTFHFIILYIMRI